MAALLTACMCASAACRREAESTFSTPTPPRTLRLPGANVILISIDTLRADRLGCYGYDRPTSPAIDALAARGVRFARVVAESSWTLPSHMTIFTGLHPTTHGVTLPTTSLTTDVPTLAEILTDQGYRAFAYCGGGFVAGKYGFSRGFEHYDDSQENLATTLDLARRRIEDFAPDERYFLFLHTYDVHCPYDPPERFAGMFRTRPREDHLKTQGRCGNPHYNSVRLSPGQVRFLSDQYDAGIRAADETLKEFFRFLDARGEWADTIVVFLSDHGEEFKEHGQIGHERTLYIESLLVPLIIVAPGLEPRVVSTGVGLADCLPTLLEMLALPAPRVQGVSLVPLMLGASGSRGDRALYSELDRHVRLRSVLRDSQHLILSKTSPQRLLFDLAADPTEKHNLLAGGRGSLPDGTSAADSGEGPVESFEVLTKLLSAHEEALARPEQIPEQQLSPEELQRLRSLGYID